MHVRDVVFVEKRMMYLYKPYFAGSKTCARTHMRDMFRTALTFFPPLVSSCTYAAQQTAVLSFDTCVTTCTLRRSPTVSSLFFTQPHCPFTYFPSFSYSFYCKIKMKNKIVQSEALGYYFWKEIEFYKYIHKSPFTLMLFA